MTQAFIISLTCMEAEYILEMAKDAGGSRVIEAFLDSDASGKHKRKLVAKYDVFLLNHICCHCLHLLILFLFLNIKVEGLFRRASDETIELIYC